MRMTWSKGAVPPRFGYFVEGQSNAVGRPLGEPVGRPPRERIKLWQLRLRRLRIVSDINNSRGVFLSTNDKNTPLELFYV